MLQIQQNFDLTNFNTFKVSAQANNFAVISNISDVMQIPTDTQLLFLGDGANILFTKDFPGLVIKNEIKGQTVLTQDEKSLTVELGAGQDWHEFVMWAVEQGLSGVENMAYIPGTVGAAAVGNIAAYGQSVGEVIEAVKGYSLNNLTELRTLNNLECLFYYRDSIFKHSLKEKFFITSVVFKLSKVPKFDTNYADRGRATRESLAGELAKFATPPYSPKDVAQAVMRIRKVKMPDWHDIGTAGSFFKNPFVSKTRYAELQKQMPDLQAYPVDHMLYPNPDDPVFKTVDQVKIPVGRLLDELGWKGKRIGNVGTFEKHALIVVNYGSATGQEILAFTQQMQQDVQRNFRIVLEAEVNIF